MANYAIPYMPIDPKGWRLAMGLRPLDEAKWLEVDENRAAELELKDQLLRDSYGVVVATTPAGLEGSEELLTTVRSNLDQFHPGLSSHEDSGEHPIVAASRLVQEDLCVLVRSDAWRLQAACVCFPSRWNLASKIGTTIDEIHRPVHRYDEQLAEPTNAVFERMKPGRSFWRLNWTLVDNPALHLTAGASNSSDTSDLSEWHFRVERQTIRRLPVTGAIVFTIRTYVASAGSMSDGSDDFAALLLNALDTAPLEMQDYKGWRGLADRLRSHPSP
jgi:hypothetical protein